MKCEGSLTVEEIAAFTHKKPTFIRRAIENGSLPIGSYNREGSRASYYISPKRAYEWIGYRREENIDSNTSAPGDGDIGSYGSRESMGNSLLLDRHNSEWDMDNRISDSSRQT